jgi:hypothetical protein
VRVGLFMISSWQITAVVFVPDSGLGDLSDAHPECDSWTLISAISECPLIPASNSAGSPPRRTARQSFAPNARTRSAGRASSHQNFLYGSGEMLFESQRIAVAISHPVQECHE